jgi:hypothetical protein
VQWVRDHPGMKIELDQVTVAFLAALAVIALIVVSIH